MRTAGFASTGGHFERPILWLIAALGLLLPGCASNAGWQYTPGPERASSTKAPVNLAVERFDDKRESENNRYFWVCVIPLVPYCTADYHRPDTANGFLTAGAYNFRPSEDLAQATVSEIRNAQMFRDVFVTDRKVDPGAPLMLRGTILNTDWNGTGYAYLLGPYHVLLYFFGLPIGTAHNTLTVRLELVQTSNGQVLWTNDINQGYEKTEGLYYDFGTDFGYPEIFRDGLTAAIASLQTYIASQPPAFWTSLPNSPPS